MHSITELETFVAVVTHGGFSAAGRQLGLSPSVVNERVKALESRLGVQLLMRTTRSQALTDPGEEYFEQAGQILNDLKGLERKVVERAAGLRGTLRIAAPFPLGTQVVSPYIQDFSERYSEASIHLTLDDRFTDVVGEGIDIAIRGAPSLDSTFIGHHLLETRRVVVASPEYLKKRGVPRHPDDLEQHACLVFTGNQRMSSEWRFSYGDAAMKKVITGTLASTYSPLLINWALSGAGVTQKSWWEVSEHIANGKLVTVLDDFEPEHATFYAILPVGRARRRLVNEFVEGLCQAFSNIDGGIPSRPEPTLRSHRRR